ncbi:alpha/beta hydrolase [Frigidibacter sp. ROC022]|uniref:alpha/beta hydrolase n=1 Tax=Frigidibacter sp. ROC022 TaxID=2971796 RepID=UPI00215A94AA|nr:alpha/beta hydrolase [Frigidibacter sp. ROC022]MCR8723051.1 alpha/beta hydrolase [Frigidibacter sp. ROC022]
MTDYLTTPEGRRIAYRRTAGQGPELVFLPGFQSDMSGTKAVRLEAWAQAHGRAFLRFDYSGHGASSGDFLDGCIGDWAADAAAVIFAAPGPKVLIGSSMGGWIGMLLARERAASVAGFLGIAAAPDFTSEEAPWSAMPPEQREELARDGRVTLPNPYGDAPTVMTAKLFTDGARQTVLGKPLSLPMPVRLLHGSADADVPLAVSLAVLDHAQAPDMRLCVLKGADHRFSSPEALGLIEATLAELLTRIDG